jgi:hypothetical protein
MPWVTYSNKKDNPPHHLAGKELKTVEYDRGWVEYALQTSDVYFCKLDKDMLNSLRGVANSVIRNCWTKAIESPGDISGQAQMALIKHLIDIRAQRPFDLPLFVECNENHRFSCGANRFTAEILCGTGADMISTFFLTKKTTEPPAELSKATPIYSTQQAELISNIQDIEYQLGFSRDAKPRVVHVVLNELYRDIRNFESEGDFIFKFWKKFEVENKINLRIHCNKQVKELIRFNKDIWQIDFKIAPMAGFSFGEILAEFNKPSHRGLNLYVYDIKEPLYLSYLLPFGHTNSVWYHTLNKKISLVDLTRGAATACWPIVVMGNFVK